MCSENKGTGQLRDFTTQLICVYVFANAKSRFSHDAARIKACMYICLLFIKGNAWYDSLVDTMFMLVPFDVQCSINNHSTYRTAH